jgi:hypothetical protein
VAAYASLVTGRSGGHIKHGAQTKNELTFQPDHLMGAGQFSAIGAKRLEMSIASLGLLLANIAMRAEATAYTRTALHRMLDRARQPEANFIEQRHALLSSLPLWI